MSTFLSQSLVLTKDALGRTLRATCLVVLAPILAACAQSDVPKIERDALVGYWAGEDYQPALQRKASWLMNRKPDGTFKIEFHVRQPDGSVSTQIEEGVWMLVDGLYRTVTNRINDRPVDGSKPQFTDEYEVRVINQTEMSYYHLRAKQVFKSKKVSSDFKLSP